MFSEENRTLSTIDKICYGLKRVVKGTVVENIDIVVVIFEGGRRSSNGGDDSVVGEKNRYRGVCNRREIGASCVAGAIEGLGGTRVEPWVVGRCGRGLAMGRSRNIEYIV